MFGRGKSKQSFGSIGLSQRLEEDRISQLPDPLICQIFSHLPTEDSVKTSVLSTRWRSLWLWVPRLKLESQDFPDLSAFVSFGDRFFYSSRVSYIDKLKLINDYGNGTSYITSWTDATVKRKIQHLRVRSYLCEIPISLYICETLVSLKLTLVDLPNAESFSLPCLKILHFKVVRFPNETTFESFVSSCPVLEELKIQGLHVRSHAKVFRVLSRSLKRLTISLHFSLRESDSGIVIDAPRLRLLSIDPLSKIERLRSFLPQFSKVKDMIIGQQTFKLICEYLKLEPLPQFGYMSRLQVALSYSYSRWLPTFLENFPNLKSLILVCYGDNEKMPSEDMNQISFSHAPRCLLSSLEFVDIRFPFSGLAAEMKLIGYLLENSAILKKFTLYLDSDSTEDEIVEKLFKFPRASTKCEVAIV